jgi:S-adenosylmethionine:tRNA ribosyltransferase-isomerase
MPVPKIRINDYTYDLPLNRIAKYPLEERDQSKLLICDDNSISHTFFDQIADVLPFDSTIIFNKSKVVPARLIFKKNTGAIIELFCLQPYIPNEYALSFDSVGRCSWIVKIGNAKRWNKGYVYLDSNNNLQLDNIGMKASIIKKEGDKSIVEFSWDGDLSFSEIMGMFGKTPIPPYLKRESEDIDKTRYQTIYAKIDGSVAAPTAGLHFSDKVINTISKKGISQQEIVLHVGAGTFVPVKCDLISDHNMHAETFTVTLDMINSLITSIIKKYSIIAVGTTSVRTLESLYWLGVRCIRGIEPNIVGQWEPYDKHPDYSLNQALKALADWIIKNNQESLTAKTEIIIVPGYNFKLVDILITNFHQPNSTLLLLIAAFIGERWKKIYNYALDNDFRFLSYGDSSLLFRHGTKS